VVFISTRTDMIGYTQMSECPKCKEKARFLWKISTTRVWLLIIPIPSKTHYVLCAFCGYTQDIKVKKINGKYVIVPGQIKEIDEHLMPTTEANK